MQDKPTKKTLNERLVFAFGFLLGVGLTFASETCLHFGLFMGAHLLAPLAYLMGDLGWLLIFIILPLVLGINGIIAGILTLGLVKWSICVYNKLTQ
jgi:hypothetical protein